MDLKRALNKIEQPISEITKWIGYISIILVGIGYVLSFVKWGIKGQFEFLKENIKTIWLFSLTAISFTLLILISALRRKFLLGLKDNFEGNINHNWDFVGPWRIPEKGILLVTGSDEGGITKLGSQWENYSFSFKAKIINKCLGVVVRAQDLNNYYMFQINKDSIKPHRRVSMPSIQKEESQAGKEDPEIIPIKISIGWEIFNPPTPINPPLSDWFDFKIDVRGHSVSIYINNELVFQKDSILQISTGKVGFRNSGSEEAYIKKVRVKLNI
ncbi:MAG: DUF1080 domain-containing protein [Proteobacteria bacterium]|nr:DUF1080 domain-containing protein [Pseudomonadota bacterium]